MNERLRFEDAPPSPLGTVLVYSLSLCKFSHIFVKYRMWLLILKLYFTNTLLIHCSTWIMKLSVQRDLENWLHTIKLHVRTGWYWFVSLIIYFIRLKELLLPGHYKWALDKLFYKHNFSKVVILEGTIILWSCCLAYIIMCLPIV